MFYVPAPPLEMMRGPPRPMSHPPPLTKKDPKTEEVELRDKIVKQVEYYFRWVFTCSCKFAFFGLDSCYLEELSGISSNNSLLICWWFICPNSKCCKFNLNHWRETTFWHSRLRVLENFALNFIDWLLCRVFIIFFYYILIFLVFCSDKNLEKDDYLKSILDDHGWVSISKIADFNRVYLLCYLPNVQFL